MDPPKVEHPLLNVYAIIAMAELQQRAVPEGEPPSAPIVALVQKAVTSLSGEVFQWLKTQIQWKNLTKEHLDELVEMQAECWCRLARLKLQFGDIHGTQECVERCVILMEEIPDEVMEGGSVSTDPSHPVILPPYALLEGDRRKLSARVWRWMALSKRFYGMAVSMAIEEKGQELRLQNELRIAALGHYAVSCEYSVRAHDMDLLTTASTAAWNITIKLIDTVVTTPQGPADAPLTVPFFNALRRVIDSLLTIKINMNASDEEDADDNDEEQVSDGAESRPEETLLLKRIGELRQQLYLGLIDVYCQCKQWEKASVLVMEAFQNVPVSLQKPLWRWRVMVMSKRGKSVLDGLQKLKENNPVLQARVYAILARSASIPKQQLEAYKKTFEILQEDIQRVDYLLEMCQWLASASVPKQEILPVLQVMCRRNHICAVFLILNRVVGDGGDV